MRASEHDEGPGSHPSQSSTQNLDPLSIAPRGHVGALRLALKRTRAEQRRGLDRTDVVAVLVQWLHDEGVKR